MAKETEKSGRGEQEERGEQEGREAFTRADFFRDLKKASKKKNRPSQPDSEKR